MPFETILADDIRSAAKQAGLEVVSAEAASGFNGTPTARFMLALAGDPAKTETLELSEAFDASDEKFTAGMATYLREAAKRLRNPRPECYVTLGGLPISFRSWQWPFHLSTSGADTYIVHGDAFLEDGITAADLQLRAKVSASMTVTFADIVPAAEQPFAEAFIYNAVRKIMDQGQIELVKSGNRQPVLVTTRYYSTKHSKFVFNDTTEAQRQDYLAAKTFWLSGVLGNGRPVWLLDPRDAQYLNTSLDELRKSVDTLAKDGMLQIQQDNEFATATEALMGLRAQYESELAEALAFTKPTFNEEMRGGHTNM